MSSPRAARKRSLDPLRFITRVREQALFAHRSILCTCISRIRALASLASRDDRPGRPCHGTQCSIPRLCYRRALLSTIRYQSTCGQEKRRPYLCWAWSSLLHSPVPSRNKRDGLLRLITSNPARFHLLYSAPSLTCRLGQRTLTDPVSIVSPDQRVSSPVQQPTHGPLPWLSIGMHSSMLIASTYRTTNGPTTNHQHLSLTPLRCPNQYPPTHQALRLKTSPTSTSSIHQPTRTLTTLSSHRTTTS